jgi:antirestriction protein ArdC
MDSAKQKIDVYEIVNNRIMELLEQGTVPWQKPWIEPGIPRNVISMRAYRGINVWLLLSLNYSRNLFLTWDQLKKVGGSVKQGEHGHVVIFWKTVKKDDTAEDDKQKNVPMLRYYKVFNIEQCRDLPENLVPVLAQKEAEPLLDCVRVIDNMPQLPEIKHDVPQAFYNVEGDYINMPKRESFRSMGGYYATLFHELVHSTGHEKRLKRKSITEMSEFGSEMYGLEELIAEMGSAYLCSFANIFMPQSSAAYIGGWLEKLKRDKRFIIQTSGSAQKAVDFILTEKISSDESNGIEQSDLITED